LDLIADRATAEQLTKQEKGLTFSQLQDAAAELRNEDSCASKGMTNARQRFNAAYSKMEAEVGCRAGEAILSKINPYLEDLGRPPVGGDWALEAGGGHGFFLPDFCERFGSVGFLDCSLVNLVLARKLVEEHGLTNVVFIRGDATSLPFRSEAFDFVHENNVIEHVADPAAMVREGLRVTACKGLYACVSPNRFSITPEPHFRVPLFGVFPAPVRRWLIRFSRGTSSEEGTDPRSLGKLRGYFAAAGEPAPCIYFLPRRLNLTARNTLLRRTVRSALSVPGLNTLLASLWNGPLLGIMPYHIAVVARSLSRSSFDATGSGPSSDE
jgi:SAM-dependent methyltransferase